MTSPNIEQTVAAELRAWFGRAALRQHDAADAAGMSVSTLSRKLNGHASFTLAELDALAVYLGGTLDELLTDARQEMK